MDKQYVVKLTQTSTNAPVATEIKNTLGGTPVWARSSGGVYTCTLANAFSPAAKVVAEYNTAYTTAVTSVNVLTITVAGGDGTLSSTLFEVVVYDADAVTTTYYCSQTDLENRISSLTLAQLTNDTANATSANTTVVNAILARVNAKIDSKAGQVYTVPFTTVPEIIKNIAIDLAVFEVFQRRPVNMAMPKDWQMAYDEAMKQLEDISNMLVYLPNTATIASQEADIDTSDSVDKISFDSSDPENKFGVY